MTNETIASRIVGLVKGIFGQKESEPSASAEEPKAAPSPAAGSAEAPATSEPSAQSTPDEESSEQSSPEAQDKETVTEELKSAEAETVAASRGPLDSAAAAASAPTAADLPVANYDTVTLPSMRARLRNLSLEDVRTLRAFETANANRADYLKMYDNRIAKLERSE